ncbi:MAG: hypothetical protein IPM79_37980 [Polyangiaceae bacterium]|nr:hypothetical protein [Polyangiaceae bacterium]MBK8943237.1 hypothetical protein [Polyangiaceae bacterium]
MFLALGTISLERENCSSAASSLPVLSSSTPLKKYAFASASRSSSVEPWA